MRLCAVEKQTEEGETLLRVLLKSENTTFKNIAELKKDVQGNPQHYINGEGYTLIDEKRPVIYKKVKEITQIEIQYL